MTLMVIGMMHEVKKPMRPIVYTGLIEKVAFIPLILSLNGSKMARHQAPGTRHQAPGTTAGAKSPSLTRKRHERDTGSTFDDDRYASKLATEPGHLVCLPSRKAALSLCSFITASFNDVAMAPKFSACLAALIVSGA
jgi:hypothetical protein